MFSPWSGGEVRRFSFSFQQRRSVYAGGRKDVLLLCVVCFMSQLFDVRCLIVGAYSSFRGKKKEGGKRGLMFILQYTVPYSTLMVLDR